MLNQKLVTFTPLSFVGGCFCIGISMGLWLRIGYFGGWDAVKTPQIIEPQLPQITLPPALQEELIRDDLTIQVQKNPQLVNNQAISARVNFSHQSNGHRAEIPTTSPGED